MKQTAICRDFDPWVLGPWAAKKVAVSSVSPYQILGTPSGAEERGIHALKWGMQAIESTMGGFQCGCFLVGTKEKSFRVSGWAHAKYGAPFTHRQLGTWPVQGICGRGEGAAKENFFTPIHCVGGCCMCSRLWLAILGRCSTWRSGSKKSLNGALNLFSRQIDRHSVMKELVGTID